MSESTGSTVECPVCGEQFDPTTAGGWCTNTECGEWQYEGENAPDTGDAGEATASETADPSAATEATPGADDPEPAESPPDQPDGSPTAGGDPLAEPTETGDASGTWETPAETDPGAEESPDASASDDVPADDGEPEFQFDSGSEDGTTDDVDGGAGHVGEEPAVDPTPTDEPGDDAAGTDEPEAGATGAVDPGADAAGTDEPGDDAAGTDEPEDDAAGTGEGAETGQAPGVECPSCGETVDGDVNFCPSCGEDVSDVDSGTDDPTACPSCGADVDADDNFCGSCGQDLDAGGEPSPLSACPACGGDVDETDSFCASCGEDLDAHREAEPADAGETETAQDPEGKGTDVESAEAAVGEGDAAAQGQEAPSSLVLATRGEEIAVTDGDTVGRELRRIVTETGGDEDRAVRIHREHVRFVREDGTFYLVDLGRNPTRLNGRELEKGDREPVSPGDEIDLSGVVALDVRRP